MSSTLNYKLSQDHVNFIIALLNEAPYKHSAPIVQTLVDQFKAQQPREIGDTVKEA